MKREEIELFPRKYRHFFSDPERGLGNCRPLYISIAAPYNKLMAHVDKVPLENYMADLRDLFKKHDRELYDFYVKFIWIRSRFGYLNSKIKNDDRDRGARTGFALFLNKYVGIERRNYLVHDPISTALKRFLPEFYPGYYEMRNPLKENLEFPFKNLMLSHLIPVREMDEATGLLQYADSKNLGINDFMDFLANWTACYNEKYGEKYRMEVRPQSKMPVYVRNLTKQKKKKKDEAYE